MIDKLTRDRERVDGIPVLIARQARMNLPESLDVSFRITGIAKA